MNELILETKNLAIGYPVGRGKSRTVASDLNLQLLNGELVCLIGPNGVGKSTLLKTLIRLQRPLSGDILLFGKPLTKFTNHELALSISVVLTTPVNLGLLSVSDLVGLGRFPFTGLFDKLNEHDLSVVSNALILAGADNLEGRLINELSDGERQKVMIARALAQEPAILVLDEPTAFLDLPGMVSIMQVLAKLAHQHQRSVLTSTHDLDLALHHADRIWLMDNEGRIVQGAPEDLVLGGQFAYTFDREKVSFNPDTGDFNTTVKSEKRVKLLADGLTWIWTKRALSRAGFEVVDSATSDDPVVEAKTRDRQTYWTLKREGISSVYTSIYALLLALKGK